MSKKIVSKYSWITGSPVLSNFNIIGAFWGDCNDLVRKHIKLLKWEPITRRNCAAQTYSTNSQNIVAYLLKPSPKQDYLLSVIRVAIMSINICSR